MAQPLLSQLNLWFNLERRAIELLRESLALLRHETDLTRSEPELNRKLYFCILEANSRLWKSGKGGFDVPPVYEGKNAPHQDDERQAGRENKIPDFQWSVIDHNEEDARRGAHYFTVECKRLGFPSSSDWVLNHNYVEHGVLRFVRPEHGYGKAESSAAMVGYIESMEPDQILVEVNVAAISALVSAIALTKDGWQINGVSRLEHFVTRMSPESELALNHLWVDLRSCVNPPTSHPQHE